MKSNGCVPNNCQMNMNEMFAEKYKVRKTFHSVLMYSFSNVETSCCSAWIPFPIARSYMHTPYIFSGGVNVWKSYSFGS